MKKLAVIACLFLSACTMPDEKYVAADRSTFDVIAPEYRQYVEADTSLTELQKETRYLKLETWELRIKTAEGK